MSCIVSSSYVLTDESPEIVLILRDENYKRKKMYLPYYPYFYVRESDYPNLKRFLLYPVLKEIRGTQTGFTGVDGSKLIKVTVNKPSVISEINQMARSQAITLFESNIPFHYRYLIDKKLVTGINPETFEPVKVESRHKKVYIDIEVLCDRKPRPSKDQLIVIGLYDCYEKKYHIIYVGRKFKVNTEEVFKGEVEEVVLHPCFNEFELIEKFAKVWTDISPDIAISFGNFDMKYLVYRLRALNIQPSFLSPMYSVSVGREISIRGLHIVEYEKLYRTVKGEPTWNTLQYVSTTELGYGKIKNPEGIVSGWLNDYRNIVEYNIRDVELLRDLEDALGLMDNYLLFLWSETGLDLDDCFMANRIGDICHMRWLNGKYILKSESDVPKVPYPGAIVEADKTGLHYNVGVFDWNELYPSIMELFHISLDTFDAYGDIKIADDMIFTSKKPGWTNEIMKPFRVRRQQIKREANKETDLKKRTFLKLLSQALKVISNAQYGLYGQKTDKFTSKFYDYRIAGAITYIGREVTVKAKEIIDRLGYTLVYRDTDSFFILLKENTPEEIEFIKKTVQSEINAYLREKYHIKGGLRLDLEYVATTLLILTKKRYHGIKANGEQIIKGLNIIRKDASKITIREQKKVGVMRLSGATIDETKEYITKVYNDVKHKRIPVDDVMVLGRCNKKKYPKITRNFKAITYADIMGIEIPPGSRFWWVYIIPKDKIEMMSMGKKKEVDADVIAFMDAEQIPDEVIIDWKKMADFTIKSPLMRYIEEEANTNKQQALSKYL